MYRFTREWGHNAGFNKTAKENDALFLHIVIFSKIRIRRRLARKYTGKGQAYPKLFRICILLPVKNWWIVKSVESANMEAKKS